MEVLNTFVAWLFKSRLGQIENFKKNPIIIQESIFRQLIEAGKKTEFGKEFHFSTIKTYADFAR